MIFWLLCFLLSFLWALFKTLVYEGSISIGYRINSYDFGTKAVRLSSKDSVQKVCALLLRKLPGVNKDLVWGIKLKQGKEFNLRILNAIQINSQVIMML